jgi:chitinase
LKNASIHYWLERGCPSKKILLGIPTYARAFKIIKRSNTPNLVFVGIESEPFVSPSVYTSEEGILSYYEVCEMMASKKSRVYWDDLAEVPFAIIMNGDSSDQQTTNGGGGGGDDDSASNLWISYEDARSARKKVEYAKQMQLGGVSIWSLDMDDFKGAFCNLGSFPIIESIKEEFEHKVQNMDIGICCQMCALIDLF